MPTRSLDTIRPSAAAIADALADATDRDQLRRTYRRLMLGLAARDLSLELRVEDAAAELADLAAGAVEAALRIACAEVDRPTDTFRLSVIGMGKCGGRELNYVSDVDVIFVYEPVDGADDNAALRSATAVAAAMMRVCSDHTREGTLWPVDAGLRPEGQVRAAGPHPGQPRGVLPTLGEDVGVPGPAQGTSDRGRRGSRATLHGDRSPR